jgi:lysophospholipase L1-like esterase
VFQQFGLNLGQILCGLRQALPQARIYVHNLYDVPEITGAVPGGLQAVLTANVIVADVAMACGASVADVYSAFAGRTGLLLIERNGAGDFEVHPTNAGYRAIAAAFEAVHQ